MRFVMRAELRSVTWAGSMVTGSARSPMTMASLGGAAPAPDARATARITRDSVRNRRIVMGGSFGRSSCLKVPRGANLANPQGQGTILEHQVSAVDNERIPGVIAGGVAGEIDGDAAE